MQGLSKYLRFFFLILISIAFITPAHAVTPDEILTLKTYLSTDRVPAGSSFKMALEINLRPGWHINSNIPSSEFAIPTELRFIPLKGITIREVKFPEHEVKLLPSIGQKTEFFTGRKIVIITAEAGSDLKPGSYIQKASFRYQGCDKDVCLPPFEKEVSFRIKIAPPGSLVQHINRDIFSEEPSAAKDTLTEEPTPQKGGEISKMIAEKGLLLSLLLLFIGGLALNLTPCVYPLIPVTLSYFGGLEHKGKGFINASSYLMGIVITYSTLGTIAALSGKMLGTQLTHPAVSIFIAGVMVALSLSMFGLYEIRVPRFIMNRLGGEAKTGLFGSFLMGATMGIVAAPCIGPFVVGLLTYVASTGDPFKGFIMFFFMSLGLGTPYLILGIFSSKISSLPRSGTWMLGVRKIFGIVLLVMAVYFLDPLLSKPVYDLLFSLVLFGGGTFLIMFDRSGEQARGFHFIKSAVAIGMIMLSVITYSPTHKGKGQMNWTPYSEEVMEKARKNHQPVIMDFYADWCIPCKELEETTFNSKEVLSFSGKILFVKVNLTQDRSDFTLKVKEKYHIVGVPTVLFIDSNGKERKELRLTGFEGPEKFINRINSLLK